MKVPKHKMSLQKSKHHSIIKYKKEMKTVYKYDEVYVVFRYGDTEFYSIFLNKDDAVLMAHEQNEGMEKNTFYHTNPKVPKFEVKTLWDAVDWVKEAVNDARDFDSFNEQS
jgi:hypothetical protein